MEVRSASIGRDDLHRLYFVPNVLKYTLFDYHVQDICCALICNRLDGAAFQIQGCVNAIFASVGQRAFPVVPNLINNGGSNIGLNLKYIKDWLIC